MFGWQQAASFASCSGFMAVAVAFGLQAVLSMRSSKERAPSVLHTHTHTPTHLTNIGLLCIRDKRTARGVKSSSQVNTRAEDHNAAVALLSALSHPSAASSSPAVSCYLLLILIPMTLPVFRPDVCVFPCRRAAAAAVEQVATQRSGRRCGRRGQNKACVSARPAALATGRNHILLLSNTSCKSNYFNKSFNNGENVEGRTSCC